MKKRIVSALLVCVLGMSLVTGCGNNARLQKRQRRQMEKFSWISGIPGEKQQSMYFRTL